MSLESYLIDVVSEAISLGYTPDRFIRELAVQWELELRERSDAASERFAEIIRSAELRGGD